VLLDKREHQSRAPRGYYVEISRKITSPRACHCRMVVFPRAERNPDSTVRLARADCRDFKRVRLARPQHA
jgi:hypothetical protein